jgi:hypothetical protein
MSESAKTDAVCIIANAMRLANEWSMTLIRSEGTWACRDYFHNWYDIRPLIDEREHHSATIESNRCAIQHVLDSNLAVCHPIKPYLIGLPIRLMSQPPATHPV